MGYNRNKGIGYGFEYQLVQRLNKTGHAKRLAVSGYPDVIYTFKNKADENIIAIIEAKCTGKADVLYIENDQIQLCFDWLKLFDDAYDGKLAIFAFRFQGSKTQRRKIKEYYFSAALKHEEKFKKIKYIRCNYYGYLRDNKGKKISCVLSVTPFSSSHHDHVDRCSN